MQKEMERESKACYYQTKSKKHNGTQLREEKWDKIATKSAENDSKLVIVVPNSQ